MLSPTAFQHHICLSERGEESEIYNFINFHKLAILYATKCTSNSIIDVHFLIYTITFLYVSQEFYKKKCINVW